MPTFAAGWMKPLPSCVFKKLSGGKTGLGVGWAGDEAAGDGDADDPDDVEVLRGLVDPPLPCEDAR